ncbi:putative transcriptional regulator love [Phialemonium atrogriseum]|uniref:Transcriptional regulator love n=1 Tax=Phialemonium atrogriseum TaxID=1093897 RepID=A0AAJ0BRT9_9PEZI|nr:putative transcriptional regulator love [Phialemonium atrogriseum]KAK1763075.1 putative transcriptional regulator love [Phialemonium atrogriseum]
MDTFQAETRMAVNPTASTALQSIRSSCDRCRFYKLKCTVPAESDAPVSCERCTRAKVSCIFGRRRRAARSGAGDAKRQRPTLPRRSTSPAPAPRSSAEGGASTATPLCEIATAAASPGQDTQLVKDAADSIHVHVPDHQQQSNYIQGINGWDLLQHNFSLDDANITDAGPDLLDPALQSPSPFLPAPGQQPTPNGTIITMSGSTAAPEVNTSSPSSATLPGQRLLTLIAEMQQRLRMLEEGPWQHGSARSLDEYPVGTVLHLSEEFAAVAGSVLSRASCAVGVPSSRISEVGSTGGRTTTTATTTTTKCDDGKFWGEGMAGLGSQSGPMMVNDCDTTSTLLVLVGYMLLIRIYGIVLGHFQVHLSGIPSGGNLNHMMPGHGGSASSSNANTSTSTGTSPSLQLGELSFASAVPDLGRIHTAVCMLLAALHGVECQLGRGGPVGRNQLVTLLTQEAVLRAGELQDGCGGLGAKVRSVKELLREKIGL